MNRIQDNAGFTLIEVIISLVLFALIAIAGVAMVDAVLKVQAQTSGRLERLGDIQRAMFVVDNDLGQTSEGPVIGSGAAVSFNRRLPSSGGESQRVVYRLEGNLLMRDFGTVGRQRLLDGVSAATWHYFSPEAGWIDHWPPNPKEPGSWPSAVALDIVLKTTPNRPNGTLRRLVALPTQP